MAEKFHCTKCPADKETTITSLVGWKMHHSRYHGTWEDAEEAEVADFFSKQAPKPPEPEEEVPAGDPPPKDKRSTVTPISAAPKPPKRKTTKIETEKANNMVAAIFHGLFEALGTRRGGKEWKPTETNLKAIDESVKMMLDAMGITLEIEQWNITLKNPLWLILVPIIAVITLYLQIPAIDQPDEEKKEAAK